MKSHFFESLRLSIPLIIAQLAQFGLGLTDTVMVGWYGTTELAALTLGHACIFFIYITLSGFALGVLAKVSQAFGKNDIIAIRYNLRMGIWLVFGFSLLGLIIASNIKTILIFSNLEPRLIDVIQDYVSIIRWMLPFILLTFVFKAFLISIKKEQIVLIISIFGLAVNIILNYTFIFGNFGAPEFGLEGAAFASLGTSVFMLLTSILYCLLTEVKNIKIFDQFFIFKKETFSGLYKIGWPICLTIMAESGMFSAASLFMGWVGEMQLAAHGIVLTIFALFFMIPLGISQAGTVRVAKTIGEKKINEVGQVAFSIYSLGLGWSILGTIIILVFGNDIISIFLDQKNVNSDLVFSYAVSYLLICCLFHIADTGQILFAAILRGFSDTKVPFLLSLFSYWIIGVPAAYYFSQHTFLAGFGVYFGIGSGLLVASLLLFFRYLSIKKITMVKSVL